MTETNFFSLRTLTDAILNIQRKLFCQFCQYGNQRIQRNDWMKFLPYKQFELFHISGLWMKNLLSACRKTLSQMSKLFLRVQATFFCNFFWKNCADFFVFFVFWLIQLRFRLNFRRQGLQNCTLRARGSSREKHMVLGFFFHFFNRFRVWAKVFQFYGENCAAALSKVHFFRQRNKMKEILFWKNVSIFNKFLNSG